MPRYLGSAHGGARPIASAHARSGRNRFAARRRRTRLEARGQVKAAIRPHDWVQHSSPPRCGKAVENLGCRSADARWASSGRSGDFTTLGPECSHSNGGRAKKTSERARTSQPFPNVCPPLAIRTASPCVCGAELSGVVGAAALTTPEMTPRGPWNAPRRALPYGSGLEGTSLRHMEPEHLISPLGGARS
jgi:hypothetical protein